MTDNSKWVACWGNATSITNRREAVYAKDLTLRYPVRMCFSGSKLRFRFSNLTGTEPVTLNKVFVGHTPITFDGEQCVTLLPGKETESDAISYAVNRGDTIEVSFYMAGFTQMNSGTLVTGPLSKGSYAYGDYAEADELPLDLSRHTNWFYFLNTIDILTSAENHAVICYGDSITAQSWPDYMAQMAFGSNASIIRRAVSGTRILRQYDCITYQAYGLKGATRFPIESNVAGATDLIIQHGINDIIHPVGTDVNPFRPWSDLPTVEEMERGVEELYVKPAKVRIVRRCGRPSMSGCAHHPSSTDASISMRQYAALPIPRPLPTVSIAATICIPVNEPTRQWPMRLSTSWCARCPATTTKSRSDVRSFRNRSAHPLLALCVSHLFDGITECCAWHLMGMLTQELPQEFH